MSVLQVCSLAQVPTVLARTGAGWAISALALENRLPEFGDIAAEQRLHLAMSDVVQPTPNYILAQRGHLDDLFAFLRRWDRETPLLIHCYAGVSRSTAIAFTTLCFFAPAISEKEHACRLRDASPTATPNRRIVALADDILGRQGRMVAAIADIGRGAECFEGMPFTLSLSPTQPRHTALDAPLPQPA